MNCGLIIVISDQPSLLSSATTAPPFASLSSSTTPCSPRPASTTTPAVRLYALQSSCLSYFSYHLFLQPTLTLAPPAASTSALPLSASLTPVSFCAFFFLQWFGSVTLPDNHLHLFCACHVAAVRNHSQGNMQLQIGFSPAGDSDIIRSMPESQ